MSADNYINISGGGEIYEVRYGFASDDGPGRLVSQHTTLEDAIASAHSYERKVGYVEYGVTISQPDGLITRK